ncbi:MAG TPA: AMP-binding protein [Myxococcota bacterium]|nr:AMP-binding protein [Myxococcota bacterium]
MTAGIAAHAASDPDRVALIFGNGEARTTFGELEESSRRIGHALRRRGIAQGGCVAALIDNADPAFMSLYWACHRTGLYFAPVNWHLHEDEIRYIVDDCDADALFVSARFAEAAARVAGRCPRLRLRVVTSGEAEGFESQAALLADSPEHAPLDDEREGAVMLYSSGTTGRPKGVRRELPDLPAGHASLEAFAKGFLGLFGIGSGDRYLCPAPLYHAAPIAFSNHHLRLGASVVLMDHFDAEQALRCIQDQRVTSSQWVPTHFRRLLQLPESVRRSYDLSSLRVAVHAAAPCPIPIKRAMIEWWGDAIVEYYGGTEGGGTLIRAREWLSHEGSVGRHWTGGKIWVLDEEGREVTRPGVEGAIYFEAPKNVRFSYHKDAAKTAASFRGDLFTIGDVGYLDADGYLYLTDRQSNMIISGGVNIYPQETENYLIVHPKVDDVAVIGVPDDEMGEQVKAVVIPAAGAVPGPELERELIEYCRRGIAHYKCPRTIDFATSLPRTETGKMAKRSLRARYWEGRASKLV